MLFQNPFFEPWLILVERQIPVSGFALHQRIAIDGVHWVNQFVGRKCRSALLALVAIGVGSVAHRTFTLNITVGEELLRGLIVELFAFLLNKLAVVVQILEEITGKLVVDFRSGARIHVKRDAEALETRFNQIVVTVHNILHRATLLTGADSDRHTMLIATTHKKHIFTLQTLVAHIDVGWHIHTCQVTDMHRTIGIRQRSSHKRAFKIFFIHI